MLSLTAPTTSITLNWRDKQLIWIDIDHRLAVLAAEYARDFGAFHHRDLVADLELRQIVELSFVEPLALSP